MTCNEFAALCSTVADKFSVLAAAASAEGDADLTPTSLSMLSIAPSIPPAMDAVGKMLVAVAAAS